MSVTATVAVAPACRLHIVEWTNRFHVVPQSKRATHREAWVQDETGAVRLWLLPLEWAA